MNKFFLVIVFFVNSVFAQDYLTLPDVFTVQCKTSFIKSIENGEILLDNLSSRNQMYWIVYSDRDNNKFYSSINGSVNSFRGSLMQSFFVKKTKNNWLLLVDLEEEIEYGWIPAKNLLLSNYSLKTEGDLESGEQGEPSIPRKAIILTSIEKAKNVNGVLQTTKKYYSGPYKSSNNIGQPKQFQALFVFKETADYVLLSSSDVLDGSAKTNKSKVKGWIDTSDITPWNTRVALEDAQSEDALIEYAETKLNGYKTLNQLNLCLDQNLCDAKISLAQFSVGPTPNNEMRRPILKNINKNVKKVISIAKDNKSNSKYAALLEASRKLQEKVNIVFVIDATASMGPYYQSIVNSIENVIDDNKKILQSKNSSLRIGAIIYRDYADGKDVLNVEPLTTNFDKVKKFISQTKCQSKDNDLQEAKFNGILNGVSKVGMNKNESNIIVLIGDCGNHLDDVNSYDVNQVSNVFSKYNINLISFQVKSGGDDTYYRFNEDIISIISNTANNKIKGGKLGYTFKIKENNTIQLNWNKTGQEDFENMFGLFVYSGYRPSSPRLLENTIKSTLKDYFNTIADNINILTEYVQTGGPTGSTPPPGLVTHMTEVLGCSYEEAEKYLRKTEFTVEAYVAMDYVGNGVDVQVPVVLLTEEEMNRLKKSLRKLTENVYSGSDLRKAFQDNIIYVCKSIIGQSTPTSLIENLTLNQIWNVILGVDFGDQKMRKLKLNSLIEMNKKEFKNFYKEFELVAKDFCDNSYVHTDRFKSRRFSIAGSNLFWIPLEDLPGCKIK